MTFERFKQVMVEDCGMGTTTDGGVICAECGELIYKEDYAEWDGDICPVCEESVH